MTMIWTRRAALKSAASAALVVPSLSSGHASFQTGPAAVGQDFPRGVELPSKDHVARLQDELRARGVKSSLSTGPIVRLMPPLVITEQEIADLVVTFGEALDEVAAGQ